MVDELFTPPLTRKRKSVQVDLSPVQRGHRPSKKCKTGPAPPVLHRKASNVTPSSRTSDNILKATSTKSRINATPGPSRQSTKKPAKIELDSDSSSEFGSDRDPPLAILRKPKAKKIVEQKKPNKRIIRTREAVKAPIVHLGAIELTDDDDDTPPKRSTRGVAPFTPVNKPILDDTSVIDLCSSDDNGKRQPVQVPKQNVSDDESLVILSSTDEADDKPTVNIAASPKNSFKEKAISSQTALAPKAASVLATSETRDNQGVEKYPKSHIPPQKAFFPDTEDVSVGFDENLEHPAEPIIDTTACLESDATGSVSLEQPETPTGKIAKPRLPEYPPAILQSSLVEAMERWRNKPPRLRARPLLSKLGTSKSKRAARDITFLDNLPAMDLLTPVYFSRAISDATSRLDAARKRAQRRNRTFRVTAEPPCNSTISSVVATAILQAANTVNTAVVEQVDGDIYTSNSTPALLSSVSIAGKLEKEVINSHRFMDILRAKKDALKNHAVVADAESAMSAGPTNSIAGDSNETALEASESLPASIISSSYLPASDIISADGKRSPCPSSNFESMTTLSDMTPSLPPQSHQSSCLSPTETVLDSVGTSKLTLPFLMETYSNDDSDSDISLSGLEFSYPS